MPAGPEKQKGISVAECVISLLNKFDVKLNRKRQIQTLMPKVNFAYWGRELFYAGIFTISVFLPGCATSNHNIKPNNDAVKSEYKEKVVSAETLKINEEYFLIKIETDDNRNDITFFADGKIYNVRNIEKFIQDKFNGKFTNREIIMGNPSIMIKGIDGKGNCCYLLFSNVYKKSRITPITSGFNAEILNKLGVEVKCIYNEKKRTWKTSYQKEKKELEYHLFSEDGKRLEIKSINNFQLEKEPDKLK